MKLNWNEVSNTYENGHYSTYYNLPINVDLSIFFDSKTGTYSIRNCRYDEFQKAENFAIDYLLNLQRQLNHLMKDVNKDSNL